MIDESDPPRLSKNADTEGERRLARLVETARGDDVSAERLAALESRLLPLIGPGAPPGPGAPAKALPAASAAMKAVVGGAVAAAVASTVWLSWTPPAHPQGDAPATSVQRVSTVPAPSAPFAEASAVAPLEPAPAPNVDPSHPIDAPSATPQSSASAPNAHAPSPERAPAPSEADLVGDAQAALAANPARALAACEEHRRLYPRGVLVQEREVLAIQALEQLGRHGQAVARGDRFLVAFPGSAHRSKVLAIVGSR